MDNMQKGRSKRENMKKTGITSKERAMGKEIEKENQ